MTILQNLSLMNPIYEYVYYNYFTWSKMTWMSIIDKVKHSDHKFYSLFTLSVTKNFYELYKWIRIVLLPILISLSD
jgi:hypothetical protein